MDINSANSIASLATAASTAKTGDAIAITVLRKALDIQEQSAMQLIQAIPQPTTTNPPNLGNGVNTFA